MGCGGCRECWGDHWKLLNTKKKKKKKKKRMKTGREQHSVDACGSRTRGNTLLLRQRSPPAGSTGAAVVAAGGKERRTERGGSEGEDANEWSPENPVASESSTCHCETIQILAII